MLSIANLSSAAQASSYYEVDNYYSSNDPERLAASAWFGRGAATLGLTGGVANDTFQQILSGKVPGGPQLGRMVDSEINHMPGIDLTFSAPKSVSILAEVLQDDNLRMAHGAAVETALRWVEAEFLQTRRFDRATGKQEIYADQKMVTALFRHDTSRALDPQLHTHAVIANMVQGPDDKWRSLHNESLYDNKMLIGLIYRSELAANLKNLGYEIERTHHDGRFELRGVPQDLIEEFSTRSAQIKEALAQFDHVTPELADKAAVFTRDRKSEVDRAELRATWLERAAEQGHDLTSVRESMVSERTLSSLAPEVIIERASAELSERQSAFLRSDLLRRAMAGILGDARPAEITTAIDAAIERGSLLTSVDAGRSDYLTTPQAVAVEAETIRLMEAGYAAVDPMMGRRHVEVMLADSRLTAGQRVAVETILTHVNRVVGVQGYAGTGKTTMLSKVRELAEGRGYEVLGLAPSAVAARTLGSEAGIEALTLQKFLSQHRALLQDTPPPEALRDARGTFSKSILVLDEASMASSQQMRDLLQLGERLNLPRLVLVGDKKQLNAVEAGKPFEQLQAAGMATATMAEIRRQTTTLHREAVQEIINGNIQSAFQKLDGRIVEVDKPDLARSAAAQWLALIRQEREATLIVAPTHQLRSTINTHIREGLKVEGSIAAAGVEVETLKPMRLTTEELSRAQSYRPGERILFNRDYVSLSVNRGDIADVRTVDARDGKVTLSVNGQLVEWSPSRVAGRTPGAVELFEVHKLELAVGDRIRWTRNDPEKRFLNSEGATVEAVDRKGFVLKADDGKRHQVEAADGQLRHLDYAWGSTVYRSQGTTVDNVIAVMESRHPHLTTQKDFYVEVSRARHGMTLVTDDVARLQSTLERQTGERVAALDVVREPLKPVVAQDHGVEIRTRAATLEPVAERERERTLERSHQRERAGLELGR